MAENTKIQWADHTFNPWVGCAAISPACEHCYAEAWARRTGQAALWQGERRRTAAATWRQPLKWERQAEAFMAEHGRRQRVFCASLADVFDNQADPAWRADLWELIAETPSLDWLLLTKRPQNIAGMYADGLADAYNAPRMEPRQWPPRNVWLGTTVENQAEAERRIPHLLAAPAAGRFLSCEPLLEAVDVSPWLDRIGWIIVGGESGPGARPVHPDWVRGLRDQCQAAGVPFFFKQWGAWLPWEPGPAPLWVSQTGRREDRHTLFPVDIDRDPKWDDGLWAVAEGERHAAFQRVGKTAAGALLDGRHWLEWPVARPIVTDLTVTIGESDDVQG